MTASGLAYKYKAVPCTLSAIVASHTIHPSNHHNVVDGGETRSRMGRKLPTINAGLRAVSNRTFSTTIQTGTYISYMSRLTVKEKQHRISGSLDFGSGFLREQLVRIAFCELSKAMAPNFSQYDTSEGSAMIS